MYAWFVFFFLMCDIWDLYSFKGFYLSLCRVSVGETVPRNQQMSGKENSLTEIWLMIQKVRFDSELNASFFFFCLHSLPFKSGAHLHLISKIVDLETWTVHAATHTVSLPWRLFYGLATKLMRRKWTCSSDLLILNSILCWFLSTGQIIPYNWDNNFKL